MRTRFGSVGAAVAVPTGASDDALGGIGEFGSGAIGFAVGPGNTTRGARAAMGEAARRVGVLLREEIDYRGAFTLDGVATADGFRPTELNPRFGAGLGVITRGLDGLPLHLVLDLVVSGTHLEISATELEALLLEQSDASRSG